MKQFEISSYGGNYRFLDMILQCDIIKDSHRHSSDCDKDSQVPFQNETMILEHANTLIVLFCEQLIV